MADIEFCKGGGCTAKLGPGALERILSKIERGRDPDLLIGFDSKDDAAVYRLTDDLAVVETLDFFPPMIEDPFVFGEIAAANAMSDVWAMGGDVRTALNIVCFPESMDLNILGKIIQGGNAKVLEAGGVLAGGHSIADSDVKYGLSVFGTVDPRKILPNNAARPGDVLILTKPLGTGLVCTAGRVGAASEGAMRKAVRSMTTLNKYAAGSLNTTAFMPARMLPVSVFWCIFQKCWETAFPREFHAKKFRLLKRLFLMLRTFTSQPQARETACIWMEKLPLTQKSRLKCRKSCLILRLPAGCCWLFRKQKLLRFMRK